MPGPRGLVDFWKRGSQASVSAGGLCSKVVDSARQWEEAREDDAGTMDDSPHLERRASFHKPWTSGGPFEKRTQWSETKAFLIR